MQNGILNIEPLNFPWQTDDPFLFCAHHRDEYPRGNTNLGPDPSELSGRNIGQDFVIKDGWRMYHGSEVPGFPYHPHRGFETITINKEGLVDHTDSLGAAGRFGSGDVQWMTAGKGVQHSEMFPLVKENEDNPLEIFQVWLNLAKAKKFSEPHFKMLWSENIPVLKEVDQTNRITEIDVIAGTLKGIAPPSPTPDSWAADLENEVAVWTVKMSAGARWILPAAERAGINRSLYFYRGDKLTVADEVISNYHRVQLNSSQEMTLKAGDIDCYFLILQGRPINEPVAQHGPFVMNTREEIQQAFADYQRTQFGGWPWPNREQVHERARGRFALHADGREEIPGV